MIKITADLGGNHARLPMFLESLSQQLFAEPVTIEVSRIKVQPRSSACAMARNDSALSVGP